MTAEGTARNVAGEAPKAELAAVAKEVVEHAQPVERPAEEREGVGGPFVIVNGDSDGLSDRGSDMGAGPEADSPSDEEDLPRSNAGPDADGGGDHETDVGESDAAVGVSSANGNGRASVESEDGVGEGKVEEIDDFEAELGEQGTAGGELGGADAPAELGIDHADADADSAAPTVDSEVNGKESEREKSAATDVAELLVHEAASEEQQAGVNATAESSGPDDAPTYAESGSTVLESEVCYEESKGEQIAAEIMDLGTDGSGASVVNGHHDADMSVDSCATATESVSHANKGKYQQAYPNFTELVEQDATCGVQDETDALQGNGHPHVDRSADCCTSDSEFKAHADENIGQQMEAPTTKAEVSDGMLDASISDSGAGTFKEPIEEEVVANGHGYAKDSADASGELEPQVDEGGSEATCGVVELEDIIGKDSEGNLHDRHTAVIVSSDEEAKPPTKEGIDEVVPARVGTCVISGNKNEEILQDDELVKDDVSVGMLHSVKQESDPFVESNGDQNVQVEVASGDENATVSDVKAGNMVDMNTADSLQTPDLRSAVEDRSIPLHVNSSGEVEEKEVSKQACPEEAYLSQDDYSSVQIGKHEQLELPGACAADKSDYGVVDAEPRKEVDMEVVDDVPLHAPAASTFHNEPRSIALVDNDIMKHSSPGTELESCDHVQAEECSSQEISSTTVDQVISGVSMEHGTAVTDDVELTYETGDASNEISSETAVDQGEPVALSQDKAVVVDDVKPSSAAGDESAVVSEAGDISQMGELSDFGADCQSHIDQSEICDTSTTREELVSLIEESHPSDVTLEPGVKSPYTDKETCASDETGKDICSETINACNISSHEVETKFFGSIGTFIC